MYPFSQNPHSAALSVQQTCVSCVPLCPTPRWAGRLLTGEMQMKLLVEVMFFQGDTDSKAAVGGFRQW